MQRLHVGAAVGVVAIDGGELRTEHVLRGAEAFQGVLDVIEPSIGAMHGLIPKTVYLHIVGEAGAIQVKIPFIDAGGVAEHHVLQCDPVEG